MNAADLATPLAAFLAGVATSVHCALMCGPLGCALLGTRTSDPAERRSALWSYHTGRLVSYTTIGALLGAVGMSAAGIFHARVSQLLPWALALLFVMIAFGWERFLPRIPFFTRWFFRLSQRASSLPRRQLAISLGLATPFLPCGPLYLVFGVALVSGSWITGATLMASFALGTIPLYVIAQIGVLGWQARLSPRGRLWTVRGLALCSALLVAGRAAFQSESLIAPIKCLLCR